MEALQELQNWYQSQCDGGWEHSHGVRIGTLDNPGWSVTIDLTDQDFSEIRQLEHESEWLLCRVVNHQFESMGGPLMLEKFLQTFLSWTAARKAA